MIKSINEKPERMEIDLTGPQGNAFYILGIASRLSKQLGKNKDEIISRMTSRDYENLIKIFEEEFGDYVTIYR